MDPQIHDCPNLRPEDIAFLETVEAGLPIAADVSRADLLLCVPRSGHEALIARHALPASIPSLYEHERTGGTLAAENEPLLFRVLRNGVGGRRQHELVKSGAPFRQDIYPVLGPDQRVIAALLVESNMVAYERQRRRHRNFRRAVDWLLEMCLRGEMACAAGLSRFGIYDGIYLVDSRRTIGYMSGIAANMFRSISLGVEVEGQSIDELEPVDEELYEEVMRTRNCAERRSETADGRVWVRKALPIYAPAGSLWGTRFWMPRMRPGAGPPRPDAPVAMVMTLLHNATEAVQKQRELNVKAAIIQEVHHRVKNNLQTIAALLRMQARRAASEETRQALGDAVNRILTVAVIHEFHSQDEYRPINVREVCQRIAQQVRDVAIQPGQEVEMEIAGPNIRLPAAQATPVAMVINELILNAMEHGLEERTRGRIEVALSDLGDRVEIAVCNSGKALPPDFDPHRNRSLGLQIVHTLVTDDLKGELRFYSPWEHHVERERADASDSETGHEIDHETSSETEDGPGACFVVTFPKRSLRVD